jgi:polysaccharide biosynthesis/export protein
MDQLGGIYIRLAAGIEIRELTRHKHINDRTWSEVQNFLAMIRNPAFVMGWLAAGLVGCSSLPSAGPTTGQIIDEAQQPTEALFDIIDIDKRVVSILQSQPTPSFQTQIPADNEPPRLTIRQGDTLSVSLWEAAGGGLFGTAPTQGATVGPRTETKFPEQVVAQDGTISIPYAGQVHAAGRTPLEVERTIEDRLAEKAIEPQAIVSVARSTLNTVTVSGDVVGGARIPLSVGGDRLLDVIAAAGGAKSAMYETQVRLSRDGVTSTVSMERLVSDPAEDIYAHPGDDITLVKVPPTFSVFGAAGTNAEIPFGADRLTLAKALAKSGGLLDQRADPKGVFLFRFESPTVVQTLGVPPRYTAPDGTGAILYHLNLEKASSYFLADRFSVKKNDLLYVANAPLTELQKFFLLINTITGPVITGVVVSRSVNTP